jgi:hypothetical protein
MGRRWNRGRTYTDTLGDLALGFTGSCIAAIVAARTLHVDGARQAPVRTVPAPR